VGAGRCPSRSRHPSWRVRAAYFAPHIRAYMRRSGAPRDTGMLVAVKDRLQALKNPYAHLQHPDISLQMVEES